MRIPAKGDVQVSKGISTLDCHSIIPDDDDHSFGMCVIYITLVDFSYWAKLGS